MNIQFNSSMKKASIGFGIALVILLVVACLFFDASTSFFWVSALFLFLGYLAIYGTVMFYLYDGSTSFKEYPANYPLIHIAIVYCIAQVLLVVAFVVLNAVLENGVKLGYYVAAELLLLLVFGIRYAVYNSGRKYSVELERSTKEKVAAIRLLTEKCVRISQRVQQLPEDKREQAAKLVRTMEEKVRYSDPMSNETLAVMEYEIERGIDRVAIEVERLLADENLNLDILAMEVGEVNNLVDSRNDRVKIMK